MLIELIVNKNPVATAKPIDINRFYMSQFMLEVAGPSPIMTTQPNINKDPKMPYLVSFYPYKRQNAILLKITLVLNIDEIIPLFTPLFPAKKKVIETITCPKRFMIQR